MDFTIELARESDDAALRRLLANNAIPGALTLNYEREPNYFHGCATMGRAWQVLVARNSTDELAGVACRATREVFINGAPMRLGYLGQLRVAAAQRGRWLVSRGFRSLHELHAADPVPGYLVSLIEGNDEALGVLVKQRRRHFPAMHEIGRLFTLALLTSKTPRDTGMAVARAASNDLPAIIAFLRTHGARRQFFPAWTQDDFAREVTRGFNVTDFHLAHRHGTLAGVMGLWDQSAFKQTVVRGYNGWMRAAKPFYNACAPLLRRPRLPDVGAKIRSAYAAFVCIADDDADVFRALLRTTLNRAAACGFDYLMLGLAERDPLLPVALRQPHIAYPSRLYLAAWPEPNGEELHARLDGRCPALEIACL